MRLAAMTEEYRKEMAKRVKSVGEEAKIAMRNVRRDCTDKVKKSEKQKEVGENESRRQQEQIQKLLDQYVKQVDEMITSKEKQVMTM